MKPAARRRQAHRGPNLARWGAIATGSALLAACKHEASPLSGATDAAPVAVASVATTDSGIVAARCKVVDGPGAALTLSDVGDRRSLEVGDGVATPDGVAVGLVHAPAAGPEALVARIVGGKEVREWVVAKRGELVPDAPPPKPLVAGGALYAAYVARVAAGDAGVASRRILLKKDGVAAPIATYPERADESLGFDASLTGDGRRAAVVWDDDSPNGGPKGGGITVAVVPLDGNQPLAPRVVSSETADPEGPRLAPREGPGEGGFWVAWMAHRPEPMGDGGGRSGPAMTEAPAEDRVFSWIEVVAIGDDGAPGGPPRRITSASGHAASFDLAPRSRGGMDVVVRDETQVREGEGGRILHVLVLPDGGAEEPSTLIPSGAGRGSVDLVTGSRGEAWVTYSDAQDHTVLLPLGAPRAPLGLPSIEEALEGGRFLTVAPGGPVRFVAAFPGADGALFREVACAE
jgi:hypothetical protein